jgi:hypothetical protein
LNDLWKYDISTNHWTWVNGDTTVDNQDVHTIKGVAAEINKPGGRSNSQYWVDKSGDLCLFGGVMYVASVDANMWKYNIRSNLWTWTGSGEAVYGTRGVETCAKFTRG